MKLSALLVSVIIFAFGNGMVLSQAPDEKEAPSQEKKRGKREGKKGKKRKVAEENKEAKAAESGLDPAIVAMMKAGTPGPEHKALTPLVGDWNTDVSCTMAPGLPPMQSKGTCKRTWVLGERFLQEEVGGEFMGMPFQGLGYMGYDNVKKKYIGSWMDSMSTTIMFSAGTSADGGKKFTLDGDYDDPATGQKKKMRSILKIESDAKHVLAMEEVAPDGKSFKMMEIVFMRKE